MTAIRILVCHPSTELYGSDRILAHCVSSFPQGCKFVVALPGEGPLVAHLREAFTRSNTNASVEIVPEMPILARRFLRPSGILALLAKIRAFRAWIRDRAPFDCGYFNTQATTFCLLAAARIVPRRLMHVHEILEKPRAIARALATLDALLSCRVVHVSMAVRTNFLAQSLVRRPRTSIVCHNGIPQPTRVDALKKSGDERLVCVLFGRIMPEKGQWFLLDALSRLEASARSKLVVRVFGGPAPGRESLVGDLRCAISERGLSEMVTLHPFVADVSEELAKADVALVPSMMRDPFPTTVLEGMAAAKCVVTTNHGGAAEIVDDGVTGFLVRPGDADALATLLATLALNPARCAEMGANARRKYLTFFTLEAFRVRFRDALGDVLEDVHPRESHRIGEAT